MATTTVRAKLLYEYKCVACGERVEIRHEAGKVVRQRCEKCGGLVIRHYTPSAIHYKGLR